jgi:26S proteasome regulatory subunit T6
MPKLVHVGHHAIICGVQVTTGARVALRNDSYTLHLLLPTKVDPLVSLMKVEKVPDSTYDMIGGLDQQIKEIKEVNLLNCMGCSVTF